MQGLPWPHRSSYWDIHHRIPRNWHDCKWIIQIKIGVSISARKPGYTHGPQQLLVHRQDFTAPHVGVISFASWKHHLSCNRKCTVQLLCWSEVSDSYLDQWEGHRFLQKPRTLCKGVSTVGLVLCRPQTTLARSLLSQCATTWSFFFMQEAWARVLAQYSPTIWSLGKPKVQVQIQKIALL